MWIHGSVRLLGIAVLSTFLVVGLGAPGAASTATSVTAAMSSPTKAMARAPTAQTPVVNSVLQAAASNARAGAASTVPWAGARPAADDGRSAWHWPVDAPWTVLRPFEAPQTRYSAGHRGIDIAAREGDPVYAPEDGTVRFSGRVVDRPVVTLEHAGDLLSSMEPVTVTLAVGTFVHRGERIGTVATGGHCDGSCVHLGARLHGEYVSPQLYLGGVPRAVLLPLHSARR